MGFRAATPNEAVRWIRLTLRTMASALEDPAAERAWAWIGTGYTDDIAALTLNQPCTVAINYADTHVSWTARPALFLPMAHPSMPERPLCPAPLRLAHNDFLYGFDAQVADAPGRGAARSPALLSSPRAGAARRPRARKR